MTLDNIRLHTLAPDARPPIALNDVTDAEFFRIKADRAAGVATFAIKNSSNLTIRMVDGTEDKRQQESFSGAM